MISLVEVPNGDSGDSPGSQRRVDVKAKARRGKALVEATAPHLTILGRSVVVVDQV